MKDLDFDELDRAVNSLMGDVSKTAPAPKPADDAPTFTISPTLGANDTPDFSKLAQTVEKADASSSPATSNTSTSAPEPTATASVETPETVSPAPANRRGGRFMDVVHPSSDMKKPGVPARPVSRQGVTVEPRKPATEVAPEKPVEQTAPVEAEPASQQSDWPDPLEMAHYDKEPETAATATDSPAVEPEPAVEPVSVPKNEEPAAPLTSPFLADAKVEKRPLGTAAATVSEPEEPDHTPVVDVTTSEGVTGDDPDMQLPPEPKSEAPLPAELQNDLVAIESGDHMLAAGAETEPATVAPTPKPTPEKPASQPSVATPTGPTSIAQQYKEEPRTDEPESGAIYDTQTYHQPLAHPEQKKSGWMMIVWIVLVILVGVAAGAAVYFMGLM